MELEKANFERHLLKKENERVSGENEQLALQNKQLKEENVQLKLQNQEINYLKCQATTLQTANSQLIVTASHQSQMISELQAQVRKMSSDFANLLMENSDRVMDRLNENGIDYQNLL
jgi:hypothetical protein